MRSASCRSRPKNRRNEPQRHEANKDIKASQSRRLDSLTLLGNDIGDFGNRPNQADERYSEMVSAYWVQFAKTGDPNGTGLPGWPSATTGNDLLLEFGQTDVTVHRDFREDRRAFWEAHFDAGKL